MAVDEAKAKAVEWGEANLSRPEIYEWRLPADGAVRLRLDEGGAVNNCTNVAPGNCHGKCGLADGLGFAAGWSDAKKDGGQDGHDEQSLRQ